MGNERVCDLRTVCHVVDSRPRTQFAGGIEKLHEAEQEAIGWMKNLEVQL